MSYVYHGVPEQMIGDNLMPLTAMWQTQPELHTEYLKKYEGREEILQRRIPLLDCLWNDVVQFLPLHPQTVFQTQVDMGLIPDVPPYRFYEIDLDVFDIDKAVVYFKTAPGEENTEVKWLRDVDLTSLQTMPQATIDYYQTLVGTGELPFNYQFIPHLLYQGTIDVSNQSQITLS